ncbi:MAG: hypothetical protein R2800_12300 [Flavipsychrobacter sp.]
MMKRIMIAVLGIMFLTSSAFAQDKKNIKVKYYKHTDRTLASNEVTEDNYTIITAYNKHVILTSDKKNPRINIQYDKPGEAYSGEEVMYNDGVEANMDRNINYLNSATKLPPLNGRIGFRNGNTFFH